MFLLTGTLPPPPPKKNIFAKQYLHHEQLPFFKETRNRFLVNDSWDPKQIKKIGLSEFYGEEDSIQPNLKLLLASQL